MRRRARLVVLCALCALGAAAHAADVHLLTAARIHTSDPALPQARAMAWDAHGRILGLGEPEALSREYPRARRIDLGDATVVPGLIDAHAHLLGLAFSLVAADLAEFNPNFDRDGLTAKVVARLAARLARGKI